MKNPINALLPREGSSEVFTLVRDRKAFFRILLPADSTSIDQKAAALLKDALDGGTEEDINFQIITESDYPGGSVISIGKTDLYQQSGLKPVIDLDADGYSIAESDGNIFLTGGRRRGSISPVIALIEEDFGGRFYSRYDGLQMPKLPAEQTVVLREYAPVFKIRTMFQYESFDRDYQLFNRVGSSTTRFDYVPEEWGGSTRLPEEFFVHTFSLLLPNDMYFDEHPEYFALIDGKRRLQGHFDGGEPCLTNPDVRRIITERVLKELKVFNTYRLFDISANDNDGRSFCECPDCMAIEKKEGGVSGPLIDFVNHVAGKVAEVYPEVNITTMAYMQTTKPPGILKPGSNVVVRLANKAGLLPYPIVLADEDDEYLTNMKDWTRLGTQLFVWEYVTNFLSYLMPRPNLGVIGRNIDTYAKNSIYGLFLQSSSHGVGENQGKMRSWVYAKKLWDPSRNMADLVRDYNYGYYGKAADYMQQYCDLLDAEWHEFHKDVSTRGLRVPFQFSKDFYFNARSIFEEALNASSGDTELLEKIELELISVLFYRLDTIPPCNEEDKKAYRIDLIRFRDLTAKYGVESINERMTKTHDRLIEWERLHDVYVDPPGAPETILLKAEELIWCLNGAEIIEDKSISAGKCVKLPVQSNSRSLQWFFGSALRHNLDYSIRVLVRADKTTDKGAAFEYGIFQAKTEDLLKRAAEKLVLNGRIDASELIDEGYSWVDCGIVNGSDTPSSFFFIAQIAESSIRYLYVSAVEFIPKGAIDES